ncbi:FIST C-terminal domain-containing protein [Blastopirellula sp. J2-11]|uniref:FIST signal transduction protein n=1 Tax=Blastopirellula sp. J2-11 TaxID=2943192 RepID=UPI0021C5964D|nr:FIST N-terminal domain-containing protein [Blastopirellula sp. J2-11]UUO05927.1 FIST C-terminal domain-containing protein [Blastopirellula sp. J2-11]
MTSSTLKFAAALSTHEATEEAIAQVIREALEQLAAPVDIAFVFVSPQHADKLETIASQLCELLGTENLFGTTGEAIVGVGREIEQAPAISLWLAHLPGVEVTPMHLEFQRTPDGGSFIGWSGKLPLQWPKEATLLLMGEPFSFPADALLARMNEDQPGVPIIGGMASGGHAPGENLLVHGREVKKTGATAIYLHGAVRVRSVVSQGCRPIGEPMVITKSERNEIHLLGGRPPLEIIREIFAQLPTSDQQLVNRGLHIGQVVDEYREKFEPGDFIIRNVIGVNQETGGIAVGDYVRPGQTIQFHVRDENSADADLKQLLATESGGQPLGALVFTCNGRGTRLFSSPNHDAECLQAACGDIPAAGIFAMGELGPIAGQNFMHGFTASLALFEEIEQD